MENIIFVDTSYTIFYRFYAIIKWYSMAYDEEYNSITDMKSYNWLNNTIVMVKYKKLFLSNIRNFFTEGELNKSKIIFTIDTPLEKLWRYDLYNEYKSSRKTIIKKYNYSTIFEYTINTLIPSIIKTNPDLYSSIKVDKTEADDIIGCSTLYLKNKDYTIFIISGDNDFLQLGDDNIIFIKYGTLNRKIINKVDAQESLKKKILYGDVSDNIPGIYKRGNKIKKNDLMDDDILSKYFLLNDNMKIRYDLNNSIINFNNIPEYYCGEIISQLKNII